MFVREWIKTCGLGGITSSVARAKLDTLKRQLKDRPEKSFQVVISKLQEHFEAVEDILRDSTIPQTHSIRRLVLDLEPRIMKLSSTDKPASTLDLDTSSSYNSTQCQVRLPKLATFHRSDEVVSVLGKVWCCGALQSQFG